MLGLLAVAGFVQNKTLLGARVRRDKKLLPALSWLSSYTKRQRLRYFLMVYQCIAVVVGAASKTEIATCKFLSA